MTTITRTCMLVGGAVLSALMWHALVANSAVIDGVQCYWLDDDQMISMRYARNLADGHGLVWNVGDRVEGYSNLLWTLMMASVHAAGASDCTASVFMRIAAWALALGQLFLALRLGVVLGCRSALSLAALTAALVLNVDFLTWPALGFEAPLVGALYLFALLRLLGPQTAAAPGRSGELLALAAMALLPLVRADGLHVWASAAVVALGMSRNRPRTSVLLLLSLIPALAHLGWRFSYYGELLPNTWFAKSMAPRETLSLGFSYVRRFAATYGALVVVSGIAALLGRATGARLICLAAAISCAYCVVVGGDTFGGSRFAAHQVPVLLALSFGFVDQELTAGHVRTAGLAGLAALVLLTSGIRRPAHIVSNNGNPRGGAIVGRALRASCDGSETVAVIAAGNTPYFSRLKAIDMLGLNDREIARLPARSGAGKGHGRFSAALILARKPDIIATVRPAEILALLRPASLNKLTWYDRPHRIFLLASAEFITRYQPNAIAIGGATTGGVYVRDDSPCRERLQSISRATVRK